MEFNWWPKEGTKDLIEKIIADMTITLRSADWMDIPPVTVEDIDIAMPPEITKQYLALEKDMLLQVGDQEVVAPTVAALLMKLRQFTGGGVFTTSEEDEKKRTWTHIHDEKIKALGKAHVAIKKAPMLVATQFTHETERILKAFPEARKFDEKHIGEWNDGKISMWVANSASISHGLNLQGPCCDVFWFSLPYDYDQYYQFNCRIARTGQTQETTIRRCLVNDSVDWAVAEVLRGREEGQSQLMAALVHLQTIAKNR